MVVTQGSLVVMPSTPKPSEVEVPDLKPYKRMRSAKEIYNSFYALSRIFELPTLMEMPTRLTIVAFI